MPENRPGRTGPVRFVAGPTEGHWFGGKPLAGIDLALVRLRSGALHFAAAALGPALSLPVALRVATGDHQGPDW